MSYMPALRPITDIPKKSVVLLRMDMDVPMKDGVVEDTDRLKKSIPTIKYLLEQECTIFLLGHLGRPDGVDPTHSLRPVYTALLSLLSHEWEGPLKDIFIDDIEDDEKIRNAKQDHNLICLENVRFWKGEEENDQKFLLPLIANVSWYVDDALAVAHRKHRSMTLHHELPTAYGIAFIEEIQKLMRIVDDPLHPLTIILGGAKKDKLSYVSGLEHIADHILIGGKLPHLLTPEITITDKFCVAALRDDGLDLSTNDIAVFTSIIKQSKMVVWAGAMGFFEKPDSRKGTEEIARAVVASGAYTVLAGGDTEASVSTLGEEKKINVIASGGGMMLELFTKKTLPAWE